MRTIKNAPAAQPTPVAVAPRPSAPSSEVAQALFASWSGDPAVSISSPPGAGKTTALVFLADQLATRAGLQVAVAAQTRAQSYDIANRIAATGVPTALLLPSTEKRLPRGVDPRVTLASSTTRRSSHGITPVTVATAAQWSFRVRDISPREVLLIDEAFQLTYANLCALGWVAPQIVMVGDPGQISPIVTGSTDRWSHRPDGPHLPAPDALAAARPDLVTTLRLPHTYRLGPQTTDLIQPLYPFTFTSQRPPRALNIAGTPVPEISRLDVAATHRDDHAIAHAAAARVRTLITNATLTDADGTRPLTAHDVAVIVPHISQATLIAAALADLPDVFTGTINAAQGIEREAVVAIHPLMGYPHSSDFATDLGRLCVALSRHRTHLTLLTDPTTPGTLVRAIQDNPDDIAARTQSQLLERLTA